jgi:hypothetical protein
MVRIPIEEDNALQIFGVIHDLHIDDDGLVRQLITAGEVSPEIILDNRVNRNVPLEMSVLFVGHIRDGKTYHLLPPRPPLTLDSIYACTDDELCTFTAAGRLGYLRHILRAEDLPTGELLAAHLLQTSLAHSAKGNANWGNQATQELITLMRDDYAALMAVLSALSDAGITA